MITTIDQYVLETNLAGYAETQTDNIALAVDHGNFIMLVVQDDNDDLQWMVCRWYKQGDGKSGEYGSVPDHVGTKQQCLFYAQQYKH